MASKGKIGLAGRTPARMPLVVQLLNLTYKLFRVSSFEALIKRLLRLVFWFVLLIPLLLLPLYFLFFATLVPH